MRNPNYVCGLLAAVTLILSAQCVRAQDVKKNAYPRPQLLIEAGDLADTNQADLYVILDARQKTAYLRSHIPGAIWIDAAQWKKAFSDGRDAKEWSKRIGDLGIDEKSKVVVYDEGGKTDAARMWWTLRYWGVNDVRLLNGGWDRWLAGNYPVEKNRSNEPVAKDFEAVPVREKFADKKDILKALKSRDWQIVDTRSSDEYCGVAILSNQRGGAIPGATHLEWSELIEPETKRFKTPAELKALFKQAGIDADRPIATHCQSGGRASVMVFGLELMGADSVRNYYAGWSDWGNDENVPIVVTEPAKTGKDDPKSPKP